MNDILRKTLGGLPAAYLARQYFFGFLIFASMLMLALHSTNSLGLVLYLLVNLVLYPYARFFYESVIDFVVGANVWIIPGILMLFAKFMTMTLCFGSALVLGPLGLACIYSRAVTPR